MTLGNYNDKPALEEHLTVLPKALHGDIGEHDALKVRFDITKPKETSFLTVDEKKLAAVQAAQRSKEMEMIDFVHFKVGLRCVARKAI